MTTRFRGLPVSEGRAAGVLRVPSSRTPPPASSTPPASSVASSVDNSKKRGGAGARGTPEDVIRAFAAVAAQRAALAARLRAAGRDHEAGIIEVAALIARDPALSGAAADAVRGGADPAESITEAAERQAAIMENLDNPDLAARAADIRQVAAAALDFFLMDSGACAVPADSPVTPGAPDPFILVRRDISPAELIELADAGEPLAGAVSVTGGASSHAAIIARGLGLPMLAGADPAVLDAPSGEPALLVANANANANADVDADADANAGVGELLVGVAPGASPAPASSGVPSITAPTAASGSPGRTPWRLRAPGDQPITVLCNVASAAETRRGLAAGAEGVGLLRTEIPFLESEDWPGYERQRATLEPILAQLAGKTAVVRLLDFSGDKIPPFLARAGAGPATLPSGAGLAGLLDHPTALTSQLRAMLDAGRDARMAVLIPMVREPAEIARVRDVLARVAADAGVAAPPVGIMVELAATASRAAEFARIADFFSIGTNDLAGDVLGLSRSDPGAGPASAADPGVLELVGRTADAGAEAGISVSVCGDAAADPHVLPLLIDAGIRVVSVAAGSVAAVCSAVSVQEEP